MKRLKFWQAATWDTMRTHSAYSQEHCCYCARRVRPHAPRLMVSRTPDGEWWLCDPLEPTQPDEERFGGRFPLPIGRDCLRKHPEFQFAVVPASTPREEAPASPTTTEGK